MFRAGARFERGCRANARNDSKRRVIDARIDGVRLEWHLLKGKLSSRVPKGHKLRAAGVAQGCAVYGPKDGISNVNEDSLTKRLDPLLP